MTHTSHPNGYRLGTTKNWQSVWFANSKKAYKDMVREGILLREFLNKELQDKSVDSILIERSRNDLNIKIKTIKPSFILEKDGLGVTRLVDKVKAFSKKKNFQSVEKINISVEDIKNIEHSAKLIAEMVSDSLKKRLNYRRVLKKTVEKVISNREVKGVRVQLSGRLSGAEIARSEEVKKGNIPLQTILADIDYNHTESVLPYGVIGIKVWIYKGLIEKAKSNSDNN